LDYQGNKGEGGGAVRQGGVMKKLAKEWKGAGMEECKGVRMVMPKSRRVDAGVKGEKKGRSKSSGQRGPFMLGVQPAP
jgi:hypothetical protein